MLRTIISNVLDGLARRGGAYRPMPFPAGSFVAFVTNVDRAQRVDPVGVYDSAIASTRLRVLIPARELARRVPVWLVPFEAFIADPSLSSLGRAGAIVIGKLTVRSVLEQADSLRAMLAYAATRELGVPLYADLSDDYAAFARASDEPFLAEYQRALGKICTFVVPCRALHTALRTTAKCGIAVIEDPYESASAQAVRVSAAVPLRLTWFGNLAPLNTPLLESAFARVASGLRDMTIVIESRRGREHA